MEDIEATQVLRDDHKKVRGLFRQLEAVDLRAPELKQGVSREIIMELEIHSQIEEEIFYPALQARLDAAGKTFVDHSIAAHQELKALLERAKRLDASSPDLITVFAEIEQAVEEHLVEEERKLFPMTEAVLATSLVDLGNALTRRKQELLSSSVYSGSHSAQVQNLKGGEQMRKQGHVA